MNGFALVVSWFLLALVFIAFGKLCDSKALVGIGAVMVLMMAMVQSVSY